MNHADVKHWQDQFEPDLGAGQITFSYNADLTIDLVCVLDYRPEERGTRDEPGCLADATLLKAFCRDVDIYDLLSTKQILHIEEAAIRDMERRIREAA